MLAHFRSQARVIDLLGREQIADSPTAIGELFKNSLDAAASHAWVDYDTSQRVLTIRDDGLGMRTEDITNKWLVLATDSSHLPKEENKAWSMYATKQQREWLKMPRYGEKGIGRLSVAILGRCSLVWTVWGEGKNKTGTLCLVHWNLFRHPRKLFEDLPILVEKFDKQPSWSIIKSLIAKFSASPAIKQFIIDDTWSESFRNELHQDLINVAQYKKLDTELLPWEAGTAFYIFGLTEHVPELFAKSNHDLPPEEEWSSEYLKSFHAFDTFWDPFHEEHEGRNFSVHVSNDGKSLNKNNRFWAPEDFSQCDHHIRIEVSKDGFAKGFIKNYQKNPIAYQKQLKILPNYSRSPGPFLVEIGYVKGLRSDSQLPDDIFSSVSRRLEHAGGFSIYRNHVRVQPYGSIDSDFAGFEHRRLKNVGRYYFASRRMFGGVFLPSTEHSELQEKAGREGFIKNGASRGLRFRLEDLFIDLADTYFGSKAERQDKEENKQRTKNKAQVENRLRVQKQAFLFEVSKSYKSFDQFKELVTRQIANIKQLIGSEINAEPGTYLNNLEDEVRKLTDFQKQLSAMPSDPPIGVVLEEQESDLVDNYISKRSSLRNDLGKRIAIYAQKLEEASKRHRTRKDHLSWLQNKFDSVETVYRPKIDRLIEPLINQQKNFMEKVNAIAADSLKNLKAVFMTGVGEITSKTVADDKAGQSARKLEQALQLVETYYQENTARHLKEITDEIKNLLEGSSSIVLVQEYAAEINRLKDREAFLIEMAQLGLITEAASHEHERHVHTVRRKIKIIRDKITETDIEHLNQLETSFDIIDSRIRMFDPLIRRKGVLTPELSGKTIELFLKQHFGKYFEEELIQIDDSFRSASLASVRTPVILGAIHNLVHNAIYWSKKGDPDQASKIILSASERGLIISDNGPGVAPTDIERIFDPGFSRRPYGRGFGLYIAKEALKAIGYDLIYLSQPEDHILEGANFMIAKFPDE
jgi:signal transduction histidine kinase